MQDAEIRSAYPLLYRHLFCVLDDERYKSILHILNILHILLKKKWLFPPDSYCKTHTTLFNLTALDRYPKPQPGLTGDK